MTRLLIALAIAYLAFLALVGMIGLVATAGYWMTTPAQEQDSTHHQPHPAAKQGKTGA